MLLGEEEWLPFHKDLLVPTCMLSLWKTVPALVSYKVPEKDQGHLCSCLSKVSPTISAVAVVGEVVDGFIPRLGLCPPLVTQLQFRVLLSLSKMVIFLGQDVSFLKASRTSKHHWQVIYLYMLRHYPLQV